MQNKQKKWYNLNSDEVIKSLETDEIVGLWQEEVDKRKAEYGLNELEGKKKKSLIIRFLEQFKDFMIIVLIIAAIISGIVGYTNGEGFTDTIIIMIVIIANAVIGVMQENKAEKSLEALKKLSGHSAKVIREGKQYILQSRELVPGDIVILETGDYVPADIRIIESVNLKVQESALTGESVPVEKMSNKIENENIGIADRTNMAFSSSLVTYGRGKGVVVETGMNTEVGKIAKIINNTDNEETPLGKKLNKLGKILGIGALVICAVIFVVGLAYGKEPLEMFMTAVSLAVAAIPEGLAAVSTIVLALGVQRMVKKHAIVKRLPAVETLGSTTVICTDKTGTLTQNKMTVSEIYWNGKIVNANEIESNHIDNELRLLVDISMFCNDTKIGTNKQLLGDPTETALINLGSRYGIEAASVRKLYPRNGELPFDSDRKMMSTLHLIDGKNQMIVKGAVDKLLERTEQIWTKEGIRKITEEDKEKIQRQNQEFSMEGLRVLAFTYREIPKNHTLTIQDEDHLVFLGLIAMMDPPREESKAAVAECIKAGIRPVMITGDHKITAAAIAKRVGILHDLSEACEGADIENMSDEELKEFVSNISVYARVSPEHKIRIVRAWQERGMIVAMTGDGVNDAPALKQADIGVAMGMTGTEVAKDAAAMVLTDDNFATIVKAVENGRNLYQNIKYAIQFLLSGNFGAILTVLCSSVAGLPVPFAPVHLLFINLLTDSLPAIALGLEPDRSEVMSEKPRLADESILTKDFLSKIGLEGLVIGAMTMISFLTGYNQNGTLLGSTYAFGTLCLARLFHGYNCKSDHPVIFTKGLFHNKWLQGAFVLGAVLITTVLTVPGFHNLFKVETLNLMQLGCVYLYAFASLLIIQLLKCIRMKLRKRGER